MYYRHHIKRKLKIEKEHTDIAGETNMPDDNENAGKSSLPSIFSSLRTKSADSDKSVKTETKSGNATSPYGYEKKRGGLLDAMLGRPSGDNKPPMNDEQKQNKPQNQNRRGFLAEMAHRMSGTQSPKPADDRQSTDIEKQDADKQHQLDGNGVTSTPANMLQNYGNAQSIDDTDGQGESNRQPEQNRPDSTYYIWETNVDEDGDIEELGFYVLSENAVILADYLSTDVVASDPIEFGDIFGVVKSYHQELRLPQDAMEYIYDYPYGDTDVFEMLSANFDGTVDKDIVEVARGLDFMFGVQEEVVKYLQDNGNEGKQLEDDEIKQIIIDLGPDHIDDYDPDILDCVYGMANTYENVLPNADDAITDDWIGDTVEALNSGEVPNSLVVSSLAEPSKIADRLGIGCMNEFVPDHVIAWCPFIRAGKSMNDCPIKRDSQTMCPVEMGLEETEITDCYRSVDYLLK